MDRVVCPWAIATKADPIYIYLLRWMCWPLVVRFLALGNSELWSCSAARLTYRTRYPACCESPGNRRSRRARSIWLAKFSCARRACSASPPWPGAVAGSLSWCCPFWRSYRSDYCCCWRNCSGCSNPCRDVLASQIWVVGDDRGWGFNWWLNWFEIDATAVATGGRRLAKLVELTQSRTRLELRLVSKKLAKGD